MRSDSYGPALKHALWVLSSKFGRRGFDTVKYHKTLWFADRQYWLDNDKTITGVKYVKAELGPHAPSIERCLSDMDKDGLVREERVDYRGHPMKLFVPAGELRTDEKVLSKKAINLLEAFGNYASSISSKKLSEITHDRVFESLNMGDEMPIYTIVLSKCRGLTSHELEELEKDVPSHAHAS